jgi:hypothetical protein
MEVRSQLHASVALPPGKRPLIPVDKETWKAPEPVEMFLINFLPLPSVLARSFVTTPQALSQLPVLCVCVCAYVCVRRCVSS